MIGLDWIVGVGCDEYVGIASKVVDVEGGL